MSYSTWQALFLIHIHDFIVHPQYRKQGVGLFLLEEKQQYALKNDNCKINLEVQNDNR
jgi:ribosomal protein S18 acetylase RimI-like enzyme